MTWEEALAARVASSRDAGFWEQLFETEPDVMHDLLADLHKASRGAEPPTLDSLWNMLAPRFTNDCLGTAVRELIKERGSSLSQLADRLKIARQPLTRLIDGEIGLAHPEVTMARIELIAEALAVHPSFFAEWRRLWFMRLVEAAFTARPNLSAAMYPRFAGHELRGRPTLVTSVQGGS